MSEHFMQTIARENAERRQSYWGRKLRKMVNAGHTPQAIAQVAHKFVQEVENLKNLRGRRA
jgi:hypothetical protein